MKKAKIIWLQLVPYAIRLGIIALGITIVLSISQLAPAVYAFGSSHSHGWASAISHLAEQDIREKEQLTNAENKKNEIQKSANAKADTEENQDKPARECLTVMAEGAKEC